MLNISFQPKTKITLYDYTKERAVKGVMYFHEIKNSASLEIQKKITIPEAKSPARWIEDRYQDKGSVFDHIINFKVLAVACFIIASIGFANLVLPVAIAEAKLRLAYINPQVKAASLDLVKATPKPSNNADQYLAKAVVPEPQNFSISIPKINLQSAVIPDVDPSIDIVYKEELKNGVAQARGSYLPGQEGTIFLFAHSTDTPQHILEYNAKFYAVKDLQPGDEIEIDYHGKQFKYSIYDKKVTSPFDLETIRTSNADLILQTCWPPGTDWKRLMVFAKEIK